MSILNKKETTPGLKRKTKTSAGKKTKKALRNPSAQRALRWEDILLP